MSDDNPAVAHLAALANALEAVADATASGNPDALGACEAPLEAALRYVPAPAALAGSDPGEVAAHLTRIRLALDRCRIVGRATTDMIAASLSAQGMAPGYSPAGAGLPAPRHGRLEVRV